MGNLEARACIEKRAQSTPNSHLDHLFPDTSETLSLGDRWYCDYKINASGKTLLNICHNQNCRLETGWVTTPA